MYSGEPSTAPSPVRTRRSFSTLVNLLTPKSSTLGSGFLTVAALHQKHVRRRKIAMHDARAVCGREPARDLGQIQASGQLIEPAAALEQVLEAFPLEQLHHQVRSAVVGSAGVEDVDQTGMGQLPGGACLAHEAVQQLRDSWRAAAKSSFMAKSRLVKTLRADQTSPMPPSASRRSSRYLPEMSSFGIGREISADLGPDGQVHGSLRKLAALLLMCSVVACSKREPAPGSQASARPSGAQSPAPPPRPAVAPPEEPAAPEPPPPSAPEPPEPPTARSEGRRRNGHRRVRRLWFPCIHRPRTSVRGPRSAGRGRAERVGRFHERGSAGTIGRCLRTPPGPSRARYGRRCEHLALTCRIAGTRSHAARDHARSTRQTHEL